MLYILFLFLIVLPVFMGFGHICQGIVGSLWEGVSSKILQGLVFLMLLWHILAFFIPINIYVEGVSVSIGFVLFIHHRLYRDFCRYTKREALLLVFFMVVLALAGGVYPFILDHFGYYVPSIKWLAEYGLVQGIANLDWVLGQMSPWHILQAGFSHFSDIFLRLNVLLLFSFLLYIIERKAWVMLCFSPILFFFIQSPSPDLPSIVFSLVILYEILNKNKQFVLLFAFSVLVFSIKPTMIWLPILAFFYPLFLFKAHLKFIWAGVLIGFLYVAKNMWLFGYPLFPMNIIDLGLPWKPYEALFITSGEVAVLKTFDLQYNLEEIAGFSTWDYLKNWMLLDGIKGIINTALIVSLLVFAVFTLVKRDKLVSIVFFSVLIKSCFILWFSAQYRFFIDVFFVIFVLILLSFFTKKQAIIFFSSLSFFVVNLLFFPKFLQEKVPSFNVGGFMEGFEINQLYKPSHYVFNEYKTYQVGNLRFNVPENYVFGFDVDLPVIGIYSLENFEKMNIFPQMKGNSLKQGFVWKKLKEKEREELKSIIEKIKK